jgi:hypothetical protein
MIEVEAIDLTLLKVDPIANLLKGQRHIDENVLDTGDVETPSFAKEVSHKLRHVALPKDLNDLLGAVFLFFALLLRNAMLVDLLAKFTHRELAFLDF